MTPRVGGPFLKLLEAETVKLRRTGLILFLSLLPACFGVIQWLFLERPFFRLDHLSPAQAKQWTDLPFHAVLGLWGGFVHPVLVALLPSWLTQIEHRATAWRHLRSQPAVRSRLFLVKLTVSLVLGAATLAWLLGLLWMGRATVGWLSPPLANPAFQWVRMGGLLAWMWLGSFPLTVFYLWLSSRISALAIPLVFSLAGLLLTISLTGQELTSPWKRDLIPWILPYAAAERAIHQGSSQQVAHVAAREFQAEPDQIRLPSGRRVRTWQNIPDDQLFPPPPPTPGWLMASFSLLAGFGLLLLAWVDQRRIPRGSA